MTSGSKSHSLRPESHLCSQERSSTRLFSIVKQSSQTLHLAFHILHIHRTSSPSSLDFAQRPLSYLHKPQTTPPTINSICFWEFAQPQQVKHYPFCQYHPLSLVSPTDAILTLISLIMSYIMTSQYPHV